MIETRDVTIEPDVDTGVSFTQDPQVERSELECFLRVICQHELHAELMVKNTHISKVKSRVIELTSTQSFPRLVGGCWDESEHTNTVGPKKPLEPRH